MKDFPLLEYVMTGREVFVSACHFCINITCMDVFFVLVPIDQNLFPTINILIQQTQIKFQIIEVTHCWESAITIGVNI